MDEFGKRILEALNQAFGLDIEINEENCAKAVVVFGEVAPWGDFRYCPDCDERVPDEPQRNEGWD